MRVCRVRGGDGCADGVALCCVVLMVEEIALIGWELFWMHPYSSFVDDVGLFGNCEVVVDEIQADGDNFDGICDTHVAYGRNDEDDKPQLILDPSKMSFASHNPSINVILLRMNTSTYETMVMTKHEIMRYTRDSINPDAFYIQDEIQRFAASIEESDSDDGNIFEDVTDTREKRVDDKEKSNANCNKRGHNFLPHTQIHKESLLGRRFELHQRDIRQLDPNTSQSAEPFIGV
eukprot:gene2337-8062_t